MFSLRRLSIGGYRRISCRLNSSNVGFIGLGNMGGPMASNLAKAGKSVIAFDVDPKRLKEVEKNGCKTTSSIEEIGDSCSVVVTMLPMTQHVKSVLFGQSPVTGIVNRMVSRIKAGNIKQNLMIIDSSTIDPNASKSFHSEIMAQTSKLAHGIDFVDAPVSGGVGGAAAGTLTFMCGAESESVMKRANDEVLQFMGKKLFYCGQPGSGEVVKLCNNLALAIQMIGVSEAIGFGKMMKIDPKILSNVMSVSTARCWSVDTYNPCPGIGPATSVPAYNGKYEGGFAVSLMSKDLNLAVQACQQLQLNTPLGSMAQQIYNVMKLHGYSEKDFGSVFDYLGYNK